MLYREEMRERLLAKGMTKEELRKALIAEGAGEPDSASEDLALIKLYCRTYWPEYEKKGECNGSVTKKSDKLNELREERSDDY